MVMGLYYGACIAVYMDTVLTPKLALKNERIIQVVDMACSANKIDFGTLASEVRDRGDCYGGWG